MPIHQDFVYLASSLSDLQSIIPFIIMGDLHPSLLCPFRQLIRLTGLNAQGGRMKPGLDVFALIIGINTYKNFEHLKGAVPDADNIAALLVKLGISSDRIQNLRNEEATGSAILEALTALKDNSKIIKGKTAILIYFAGHGGRAKVPGKWKDWQAPNGYIEVLCPVDAKDRVYVPNSSWTQTLAEGESISDRRITTILRELSDAKGNNITLICDCCHSAGLNRGGDSSDSAVRATPDIVVMSDSQSSSLERGGKTREGISSIDVCEGFRASWNSHVFIAACSHDQQARETSDGGRFTGALHEVVGAVSDIRDLTYNSLVESINARMVAKGYRQTPFISGKHIHRHIFTLYGEAVARQMIPCQYLPKESTKGRSMFSLRAGNSAGVRVGSTYDIYPTDSLWQHPLMIVKVTLIQQKDTLVEVLQSKNGNADWNSLADGSVLYAQLRQCSAPTLHIYCIKDDISLLNAILSSTCMPLRYSFQQTNDLESADICLEVNGNKFVSFSRGKMNSFFEKGFSFNEMEHNHIFHLPQLAGFCAHYSNKLPAHNTDELRRLLDAYAHFTHHLTAGGPKNIQDLVSIEMHEFKWDKYCLKAIQVRDQRTNLLSVDPKNMFVELPPSMDTLEDAQGNPNAPRYGFKISRRTRSSKNEFAGKLYPHIFLFDASTLQVNPIYSNMTSSNSKHDVEALIKEGDTVTFGLPGDGGPPPLVFGLLEGQKVDVNFIKIVITTAPVDLRCISQPAFEPGRERAACSDRSAGVFSEVWASKTISLLLKSAPDGNINPPKTVVRKVLDFLCMPCSTSSA
ncbi:hypothetical protein ARMGADRAFT_1170196 [Armillaria gallica]|uniref:Caspase family p20 domain-containing protein n=1 Tax=Armillaria gallica TaxID=47427 RepID=A0A2H3CZV0_ARMGA|nr:hypothetical protein ARMGADRAFT_1170196 [Armillaria gallica]